MNRLRHILLLSIASIAFLLLASQSVYSKGKPKKDQVVVRADVDQLPDSLLEEIEGDVINDIPGRKTFLVHFPEVVPIEKVIRALQNNPHVQFAEPNYEIKIAEILQISISSPDQFAPPLLYRRSPLNYYQQQSTQNIQLDSAHLLSSGEGIVVAVIDNGIDFSHPLFEGSIDANGYDFVDNDDDPSEDDPSEEEDNVFGHGTFVSGLVKLVAPNSSILPIRVFDEEGEATTFNISRGLLYAAQLDVDVINMSFGLEYNSQLLDSAVSVALENGITLIAASGNDGVGEIMYPAAYPGVVAVTSLDSLEFIADFSNYGSFLDVSAPGVNLYSALAGQYQWGWWSGTSFSASIVSGVAALIKSRRAELSPFQIETIFRNTSRTDLVWGSVLPPDTLYGYGVVDAFNALLTVGRGDINNSGHVDVTDLNYYVNFVFRNGNLDGWPAQTGDFNCDNKVNLLDLNAMVNYIFREGKLFDPCYEPQPANLNYNIGGSQ